MLLGRAWPAVSWASKVSLLLCSLNAQQTMTNHIQTKPDHMLNTISHSICANSSAPRQLKRQLPLYEKKKKNTDAFLKMSSSEEKVIAYRFETVRFERVSKWW